MTESEQERAARLARTTSRTPYERTGGLNREVGRIVKEGAIIVAIVIVVVVILWVALSA